MSDLVSGASLEEPSIAAYHLRAWTEDGRMVLEEPVTKKTLAMTSCGGGDLFVPELGGASAYLRANDRGGVLFWIDADGLETRVIVELGKGVTLGPLTWLLTRATPAQTVPLVESEGVPGLVHHLMAWLGQPMDKLTALRSGLASFLEILIAHTPASSGMLVLAEREGFALVSCVGLSARDAQRLWERMPHSLVEDVLRLGARVLLPDELRRAATQDTTVFVKGIRSAVGLPVLAEGKVLAVFYLGFDNLLKHFSQELQRDLEAAADLLGMVIQRAALREQMERLRLREALPAADRLPNSRLMVGSSPKLVEVYHLLSRLAPVDVSILVTGETGTGKELAAKELHQRSARASGPFVVVNAAALPDSLIESELFGHRRGAFTGAISDRVGLVEQAQGGTLFFDEVGELSLAMQAKLLRVLQERVVTRIGDTAPRCVDFRLVAATHRPLQDMVMKGSFREDLFYRLAGAVIRMPAVRERMEDVIPLANYFRKRFAERHGLPDKEWSQEARRGLMERPWPGNVREIENVVTRAFIMAEGACIAARDLGDHDAHFLVDREIGGDERTLEVARDAWTREFLASALRRHRGHRAETARALGVGERTLFRYIEQLGIGDH